MPSKDRHINFALMRDRVLANQDGGKQYWRSLEELADTPEFREFVEREYPQQAEEWNDPVGRRTFIKLMGASLALAGLRPISSAATTAAGGSSTSSRPTG